MKIRIGRIFAMQPQFSFHIGRETFFKGLTMSLTIWTRGIAFTFTTKKIYAAYLDKSRRDWEAHRKAMHEQHFSELP